MKELKPSIYAGLAFMLLFGICYAFITSIKEALIAAPVGGLFFGVFTYLFSTSKWLKRETEVKNLSGEPVLHSGMANHMLNNEAVGGRLYLLPSQLQFQSHSLSIQKHSLVIPIHEVKEVGFYNSLGIMPRGLAITTTSGTREKFVVSGRKQWKEEIEKCMQPATV